MIIDANATFGFDRLRNRKMDGDTILHLMDDHEIDKCIISCNECMYFDFIEGNLKTATLISEHPDRFIGLFSLHPARYFNVLDEIKHATIDLKLKGFRLFFTEISFGRGWSSGLQSLMLNRICEQLSENKIPVFIDAGYTFADIKSFVSLYPSINFIASGIGYANMAEAIIALEETNNLYLEMSTSDAGGGIETLVDEVGSEKLIFGTGMPFITPGVSLASISHADISPQDRENILHRNITRILES